jgi:hypothetical protein
MGKTSRFELIERASAKLRKVGDYWDRVVRFLMETETKPRTTLTDDQREWLRTIEGSLG